MTTKVKYKQDDIDEVKAAKVKKKDMLTFQQALLQDMTPELKREMIENSNDEVLLDDIKDWQQDNIYYSGLEDIEIAS